MLFLLEKGMFFTSGQVLVAFLLLLAALQAVLVKWQSVSIVFVLIFCRKGRVKARTGYEVAQ